MPCSVRRNVQFASHLEQPELRSMLGLPSMGICYCHDMCLHSRCALFHIKFHHES